jgi:hypothetical protein
MLIFAGERLWSQPQGHVIKDGGTCAFKGVGRHQAGGGGMAEVLKAHEQVSYLPQDEAVLCWTQRGLLHCWDMDDPPVYRKVTGGLQRTAGT